jgi:hypothetical protein
MKILYWALGVLLVIVVSVAICTPQMPINDPGPVPGPAPTTSMTEPPFPGIYGVPSH